MNDVLLNLTQVVVLCGVSYKKQLEINDWTRANNVYFIAAETRGLLGYVFCLLWRVQCIQRYRLRSAFNDFGPKFTCVDPTGEQPLSGMIVSVEKVTCIVTTIIFIDLPLRQDSEGLVTCLDETRHGLEDGDFVTFTEVQGMTELNG